MTSQIAKGLSISSTSVSLYMTPKSLSELNPLLSFKLVQEISAEMTHNCKTSWISCTAAATLIYHLCKGEGNRNCKDVIGYSLFLFPFFWFVVTSPWHWPTDAGWSGPSWLHKEKVPIISSWTVAASALQNEENCLPLCGCNYYSMPATISPFYVFVEFILSVG